MIDATEALTRLREGNRRFATDLAQTGRPPVHDRRAELLQGQAPFAVILGCSDSRVPAEMIFDQGLGDLFVIRVAGNIVAPSQLGSVEFAVEKFGTRLVVVLGHSMCGAVMATLEEMDRPAGDRSRNLEPIVGRIRPAVEALFGHGGKVRLEQAIQANIRASVAHLRSGSQLLQSAADENGLQILGAEYCLESGLVNFFA